MQSSSGNNLFVKVYHGYGHAQNLVVFGHVLRKAPPKSEPYKNGLLFNLLRLLRLFFVQPVAGVKLRLRGEKESVCATTEDDGFFKLEWTKQDGIEAGWHTVTIDCVDAADNIIATGEGRLFVPHITQYAFISDIDDTVLVSHSATISRRLRLLFFKNPHTRTAFPGVAEHYRLLSRSLTDGNVSNPFFYVSSSEWNLYNDLIDFFKYNHLPEGIFLLNSIKRWYQILKTGKTKHEGKILRAARIFEAFPNQQFVLLGDNSQLDPTVYAALAEKYPVNVYAVYIRNVSQVKEAAAKEILAGIEKKGIHTCFFTHSQDAIEHSVAIGLLNKEAVSQKKDV